MKVLQMQISHRSNVYQLLCPTTVSDAICLAQMGVAHFQQQNERKVTISTKIKPNYSTRYSMNTEFNIPTEVKKQSAPTSDE